MSSGQPSDTCVIGTGDPHERDMQYLICLLLNCLLITGRGRLLICRSDAIVRI